MVTSVEAVYDGQVLRPDKPVELAPNTRVRITIETIETPPPEPLSFLTVAQSLNLEGPTDWSENIEDYLDGGDLDAGE